MDDRQQLLLDLEAHLRQMAPTLDGSPTPRVTRRLTGLVAGFLAARGLEVELESPIRYCDRDGVIDVVGRLPGAEARLVAVEIDLRFRFRSLHKLTQAAIEGAASLWIRWGAHLRPWEPQRMSPRVRRLELPLAHETRNGFLLVPPGRPGSRGHTTGQGCGDPRVPTVCCPSTSPSPCP
jgi:hypothetical protein